MWDYRFGHASNAQVLRVSRLLIEMNNLGNINYDPIKVYSNSKQSEPDTSPDKLYPNTKNPTKSDKPTNNPISIGSTHMIKDSDFDSLYSPCIAIKQTRVVIWNKPMTKVDDKLD